MKKKMPKVSIIVPFNDVEHYIDECLQSIENQTLKDIEIILINDNSQDNSLNIAQNHAQKDKRIRIIDIEKRKGQGFARNRGIEAAQGEYIGFVDSDDFVEENAFELMYNAAKENDTDITMCQVKEYDDLNKTYITSDYYNLTVLNSFENRIFSAEETKDYILDINVALWNKLYKRSYLLNTGEKFPQGYIYEDLPFFFGTYLPAKRIQIIWESLYNYRVNRKNSTMRQFNNKILDRLPMVSLTYEKLKSVDFLADKMKKIQCWIIDDLFHRYTLLQEGYQKEFFFQMKKIFRSLEIEDINDPYLKRAYHFKGYLLVLNNSFDDFNQKVFNEYLDIHEVEDRIKSSTLSVKEIDERLNNIYGDIDKNYKYTEKVVNEAEAKTLELKNDVEQIYADLCKKIDAGCEKTLHSNAIKIEEAKNDIYKSLPDEYSKINALTDEKISRVYSEITKNYEYTNKLNNDVKIQTQQSVDGAVDWMVKDIDTKIAKNCDFIETRVNESEKKAASETDEKLNKVYDELSKNYEYTNNLNSENKEFTSKIVKETSDVITSETDIKLQKVYDKITENTDYIDNSIREFKELTDKNNVQNAKKFGQEVDLKIENLNKEILSRQDKIVQDISKKSEIFENTIKKEIENKNNKLNAEFTSYADKISSGILNQTNAKFEEIKISMDETRKQNTDAAKELKNEILQLQKENLESNSENSNKIDLIKTELINSINENKNEINTRNDEIISKVYDQIQKQNEYQNDINARTNQFITDVKNNFEIKTNNINNELNITKEKILQANEQIDNLHEIAENNKKELTLGIDDKTSKLFAQIQENHKYTENILNIKSKELYNDIKDLSYILNNNRNELNDSISGILNNEKLIKDELAQTKRFYEEKYENLRKEYGEKYLETELKLQKISLEAAGKLSEIILQTAENKRIAEELKSEFEEKLQQERIKHTEEIELLKSEMIKNIDNLREEMKSPLSKLFDKNKKKSEK